MAATGLLLAFWLAFGLALISPGPNFAVLLATAAQAGRAAALRLVLGIALGEAAWGLAAVLGVAALAQQHAWLGLGLRVGGGGFLLYLAVRSLWAAWQPAPAGAAVAAPGPAGPAAGIRRGLMVMLTNPKAGAFWLSLTSLLLGTSAPLSLGLIAVAGAILLSLAWHGLLAVALSSDLAGQLYRRLRRRLEAALGLVLAALGLRLILAG